MASDKPPSKLAADRLVFRPESGPAGDVLVAVFLRGGMDAVYTIPPFADPAFYSQRKDFGFAEPSAGGLVDLDGFFGLHPDFAPLAALYQQQLLAIVHGVGLDTPLLSHFEATEALERGTTGQVSKDGWLGRHLNVSPPKAPTPLRAIALSKYLPPVLRGGQARALESVADFRLNIPAGWQPGFAHALQELYATPKDVVAEAGRGTLEMLAALAQVAGSSYQPDHRATYGADPFGRQMQQVAQLVKAEIGLEAAVLSMQGWDSHVAQSQQLARPMQTLARGLQSFAQDLGDQMRRVTVVVISEFGRRIAPNMGGGTDHGRATAMLVVGGGIRGGRMYGRWPGLANDQLDEQGNLRVTTDYRHVLAEIFERRLKNPAVDRVFPEFQPQFLGLTV